MEDMKRLIPRGGAWDAMQRARAAERNAAKETIDQLVEALRNCSDAFRANGCRLDVSSDQSRHAAIRLTDAIIAAEKLLALAEGKP